MRSMRTPTTVQEIVEEIVESMSEADKANVVNTSEDDLIMFHHGSGTGIRNHYLYRNSALVAATGKEHPDDASMVIIKAVWQALRDSDQTYQRGKIETETLQWREVEQCLEISTDTGRSLIIQGIDFNAAQEIAKALRMTIFSSASHTIPEAAPRPILEKRNITLQVWTYPKHPDNQ